MSGCKKQPKTISDRPSAKYKCNVVKGASSELADLGCQEYPSPISNKRKQNSNVAEPKSVEILTTAELVSAVGQLWDRVDPLAILKPNGISNNNDKGFLKEDILGNIGMEVNGRAPTSADSTYFHVDLRAGNHFSHMMQPNVQFHKVSQKVSAFEMFRENHMHSTLQRFAYLPRDSCKGNELVSLGISCELGYIYGWMSAIIPSRIKYLVNTTKIESKKNDEHSFPTDAISSDGGCLSGNRTHSAKNLAAGNADCHPDLIRVKDLSFDNSKLVSNTKAITSLYSDYLLGDSQDQKVVASVLRTPNSGICADYHIGLLASCNESSEECQHKSHFSELLENERKQYGESVIKDEPSTEISSTAHEKSHRSHAKQEHAFAGALAGICVSLCLHPVDTIKTVIQSCRADQKSIFYIGRSIVSERGLNGLYRGITSNIASSAPISAIYTFTYESVKGALLPLFPKEYYSIAHCVAGGCASIATSFVFTPSEHIKQQMQVGSHYHNSWSALVGTIGKGGLPSLYAGWGAVLCRNVPHSIIKFYTYESLKQLMLSSQQSNAQPSALQTLLCGGLAGSTAALCTTPFDVVKTRLQTQIPGSSSQYNNVLHALQEIGKQEGLKGLYRGLVPRLIMYMSQGALFFSSYEFFKSLFSSGLPQINGQRIKEKQNRVDDSTSTPLPSSASPLSLVSPTSMTSSSSSRKLHS